VIIQLPFDTLEMLEERNGADEGVGERLAAGDVVGNNALSFSNYWFLSTVS
jgi:hypothetical protein